jgi:hypothetical protein
LSHQFAFLTASASDRELLKAKVCLMQVDITNGNFNAPTILRAEKLVAGIISSHDC